MTYMRADAAAERLGTHIAHTAHLLIRCATDAPIPGAVRHRSVERPS